MKYVIKHLPSNRFTNLTFRGLDALNLGINPKVYKEYAAAQRDMSKLQSAIDHNLSVAHRIGYASKVHANPNSSRKYKEYKNKSEFLEEKSQKLVKEYGDYKVSDFIIEEYAE
jgi:hypothetical protein